MPHANHPRPEPAGDPEGPPGGVAQPDPVASPGAPGGEVPRGDAALPPMQEAETPKPRGAEVPLPADHPSRGMIDEGGVQR